MQSAATASAPDSKAVTGTVLCVDDEPNILSSLNRLLRPAGHRVLTAGGGAAGLAVLEKEQVDVIISDMRMPEMDGAAFLEAAAAAQPGAVRILLTGYADVASAMAAINKGGIYRYLAKPWEENDLRLTVQRALEQRLLEKERRRLEELTRRQNEELKDLNANLEAKVEAKTGELTQLLGFLEVAHNSLKKGYTAAIKVMANLVELRAGAIAGHSRRVADCATAIAQRMRLAEAEILNLQHAALLHDIGRIGFPDSLMHKPFASLTAEEKAIVTKHPLMAEAALMDLEPLRDAARIIHSHHERYDGQGYPDGLRGEDIPLGARILAVANDYDGLQIGLMVPQRMRPAEARRYLVEHKGTRYDPAVVDALLATQGETPAAELERRLGSEAIEPGMVLTRDLTSRDGLLLLPRGRTLDEHLIKRIRDFERAMDSPFALYVRV